jgi:hypothetical protein
MNELSGRKWAWKGELRRGVSILCKIGKVGFGRTNLKVK